LPIIILQIAASSMESTSASLLFSYFWESKWLWPSPLPAWWHLHPTSYRTMLVFIYIY